MDYPKNQREVYDREKYRCYLSADPPKNPMSFEEFVIAREKKRNQDDYLSVTISCLNILVALLSIWICR